MTPAQSEVAPATPADLPPEAPPLAGPSMRLGGGSLRRTALRGVFGLLGRVAPTLAGRLALRLFLTPHRQPPRPWEAELAAAGRTAPPVAAGLHAIEWGEPHAAPVLLMHGWDGRGTQLGAFVAPLVAAGLRVLALDAPAHGRSAGRTTSVPAFAEAVLAAARALGPLRAVIGHSMGAAATVMAVDRGLDVQRVALVGGPGWLSRVSSAFPHIIGLPDAAARSFARQLEQRVGLPATAIDPVNVVARGARTSSRWSRIPALVIHDRADHFVPTGDAEEVAKRWPGARFLLVDAGGHGRMLRDPDVVRIVTTFVAQDAEPSGSDRPPAPSPPLPPARKTGTPAAPS